jgi:hypothetical protein
VAVLSCDHDATTEPVVPGRRCGRCGYVKGRPHLAARAISTPSPVGADAATVWTVMTLLGWTELGGAVPLALVVDSSAGLWGATSG